MVSNGALGQDRKTPQIFLRIFIKRVPQVLHHSRIVRHRLPAMGKQLDQQSLRRVTRDSILIFLQETVIVSAQPLSSQAHQGEIQPLTQIQCGYLSRRLELKALVQLTSVGYSSPVCRGNVTDAYWLHFGQPATAVA